MAPAWWKIRNNFLPYVLDLINMFLPRFQFEGKTDV